jgi:hypothetical protein
LESFQVLHTQKSLAEISSRRAMNNDISQPHWALMKGTKNTHTHTHTPKPTDQTSFLNSKFTQNLWIQSSNTSEILC